MREEQRLTRVDNSMKRKVWWYGSGSTRVGRVQEEVDELSRVSFGFGELGETDWPGNEVCKGREKISSRCKYISPRLRLGVADLTTYWK